MQEIWRDIKGYEGLYQVSNFGKVKRILFVNNIIVKKQDKILKNQKNPAGYNIIALTKNSQQKTCLVHRLVAEAFIEKINGKTYINHKDGNKANNRVENLEWCTQKENMQHAVKHNLINYSTRKKGSENPRAIKVNMLDKENNSIIKSFNSIIEASQYIGKNSSGHIVSCCKGRLKSAYGYKWEYA